MTSRPSITSQHIQRMSNYVDILAEKLIQTNKALETAIKAFQGYKTTLSEIANLNPQEYNDDFEMRLDLQERARKAIILDEQL